MSTITTKVGHSTGGVVVARYIGRHGTERVANVVLIGSVTPSLLKTPENPAGTSIEVFDGYGRRRRISGRQLRIEQGRDGIRGRHVVPSWR